MTVTAIVNANLILEDTILENGALLIEDGRIAAIGREAELTIPDNAIRYDAEGRYVGPGFVDIHVHGGNGVFFFDDPEKASAHFLSHGETTVLATLYYDLSKEAFLSAIHTVKGAMGKGVCRNIGGFYMEGPYMNPKYGASAHKNQWKGAIEEKDYRPLLEAAGDLAKVWAIAPERQGITPFLEAAKASNPNTVFAVGHSEATPAQVFALKPYGIGLQTHCMNATGRPDCIAGTRSCGPDEACLMDPDIMVELICDSQGIHVPPDLLGYVKAIKGVDKILLISDSFACDGEPPAGYAHVTDLSFNERGELSGSKLTMDVACRNWKMHTGASLVECFRVGSLNPSRALRMDHDIGSIAMGKKANLVVVNDEIQIQKVILEGDFIV